MRPILIALAIAALPYLGANAATIDTFKTGVDESTGTVLANGVADTNWQLVSLTGGSDGTFPRAAITTAPEPGWYSGIPMAGTGLITRGTSYNGQNGTYAYEYQFVLSAGMQNLAVGGLAWADDQVRVLLNGNEIMAMSAVIWNAAPVSFTNSTQAYFVTGTNTLRFEVFNSGGGPTALNVSGVVTGVPEAHEWAMMFLAIGVVGWLKREDISRWLAARQANPVA
jgi:hypothetical protein